MTQPPSTPSVEGATRLVRTLVAQDREAAALLTAHPGPHWTPRSVAALWGLRGSEAQARVTRLQQLDVLTAQGGERYTMNPAVRVALERSAATVLLPGLRRARTRLVAYYTDYAIAADLALDPGRWRWHPPAVEQVRRTHECTPERAHRWFHEEADNLGPVMELAHNTGHHQQAILMAEAVGAWDELQRPPTLSRLFEFGVASADAVDDDGARAVMHHAMAAHHLRRDGHQVALGYANYALALWSSTGSQRTHPHHERGLVHLYLLLAQAHDQSNDLQLAARYTDLAARVAQSVDHPFDTALVRYRQALALHTDERLTDAVALLRSALALMKQTGEVLRQARTHRALCEALLDLDQAEVAREHGHAALDLLAPQTAPMLCGQTHESLAWVASALTDHEQAHTHFAQARACYAPVDPVRAQQMPREVP